MLRCVGNLNQLDPNRLTVSSATLSSSLSVGGIRVVSHEGLEDEGVVAVLLLC